MEIDENKIIITSCTGKVTTEITFCYILLQAVSKEAEQKYMAYPVFKLPLVSSL